MSNPRLAPIDGLLACLRGAPPRDADWMAILAEANARLVSPALFSNLVGPQAAESAQLGIPDDVRDYLGLLHERNLERNTSLAAQLAEAARALNAHGVSPMVIKGAAHLLDRSSPAFGARVMADLDLVIVPEQASAALAALAALGYCSTAIDEGEHAVGSFSRPSDGGAIDVHHRISGPVRFFDMDRVWAESARVELEGAEIMLPSRVDLAAITIVQDYLHDKGLLEGAFDLRRVLDIAIWTADPEVWRALDRQFRGATESWTLQLVALNLALIGNHQPSRVSGTARLLHARQMRQARSSRWRAIDERIRPAFHRIWLAAKALRRRTAAY
jgi:hypothetical protein